MSYRRELDVLAISLRTSCLSLTPSASPSGTRRTLDLLLLSVPSPFPCHPPSGLIWFDLLWWLKWPVASIRVGLISRNVGGLPASLAIADPETGRNLREESGQSGRIVLRNFGCVRKPSFLLQHSNSPYSGSWIPFPCPPSSGLKVDHNIEFTNLGFSTPGLSRDWINIEFTNLGSSTPRLSRDWITKNS